jgi:hypothetical protein
LTDKETVLRFLDGWHQGILQPFPLQLVNDEELLNREDVREDVRAAEEQRMSLRAASLQHRASSPQHGLSPAMFWEDLVPSLMRGIIVWFPTAEHAQAGLGPDALYYALLNHAHSRLPREDEAKKQQELEADHDDKLCEFPSNKKKLMPWIEKVWIFGLQEGADVAKEKGMGDWQPPGAQFLHSLTEYVVGLSKKHTDKPRRHAHRDSAEREQEMLISPSDLFDEGLRSLRSIPASNADGASTVASSRNLCLRTARTRRGLYGMMMDELSYHLLVQYPPPLYVLFVGDLPPPDALPWPTLLERVNMDVLGQIPDAAEYSQITPCMQSMGWIDWLRMPPDTHLTHAVSRHVAVPI